MNAPNHLCLAAIAITAITALTTTKAGAGAPSQDTPDITPPVVFVVMDASGSMWGKLPGTPDPKFQAVETAVTAGLAGVPANAFQPGLVSFGGRCTSAKLTIPPSAASITEITKSLSRLNPKGKGPISLALDKTSTSLPKGRDASIILIHDGPDNCGADPCLAAGKFAKAHPHTPVHLISIGLPKAARVSTACIAKLTGGTVAQVENANQLTAALDTAIKHATRRHAPKTATNDEPGASEVRADADKEADRRGPSRLRLSAVLTKGSPPLPIPVRWRIYDQNQNKTLLDIAEPRFTLPLKPGTYTVHATVGLLHKKQTVAVKKTGATILEFALEAGKVRLLSTAPPNSEGGTLKPSGIGTIVTLSQPHDPNTPSPNQDTQRKPVSAPIVVPQGATSELILPTGNYRVTIERGLARADKSITVDSGKTQDIDLGLKTGELRLALAAPQSTLPEQEQPEPLNIDVLYKILVDDPDAPNGRREIARSTARSPSFHIPGGTYYITASAGTAIATGRVALGAGDVTTLPINLQVTRLNLHTNLSFSSQGADLPILYRVIHLDANQRQVAQSGQRNPSFILAPGKYRIVAEIGARNVNAQADVNLASGQTVDVKLNPPVGEITLKLSGESSATTINRFWVVRDQNGDIVWRSSQFAPRTLLAPGDYEVSCETRAGRTTKSFALASGESKSVELTLR